MAKKRTVEPREGVSPPRVEDAPPPPPPLVVEVAGRPVPKGAVAAFVVPGKSGKRARAVVVQGGSKARRSALGEWCSAIADAALEAVGAGAELEVARFVGVPVEVEIEFRLPRPKAHHVAGDTSRPLRADAPTFHTGTPDVDKLTRAALDALIGVAFDDDSRVARTTSTKIYAAPGREGARIRVAAIGASSHLAVVRSPDTVGHSPPPPPPHRSRPDPAQQLELGCEGPTVADVINRGMESTTPPALSARADTLRAARGTGRTCEVDGCGKATPYTDWTRCEEHNASAPSTRRRVELDSRDAVADRMLAREMERRELEADTARHAPQLGETKPDADRRRERVRRLIGGTTFEAESHAFAKHARVTKCDGEHAGPPCGDPLCYAGAGAPETRAFPDEPELTPDDFGGPLA